MDILEYFSKINNDSQKIFKETLLKKEELGTLHSFSSYIYEFSTHINTPDERALLLRVCNQLEFATFSIALGLYRQGFSSLRLGLEMGMASIYFSAHQVELKEWLINHIDISWLKLIDADQGVLSKRFINAFFKECAPHVDSYRGTAKSTYRKLSEYVHGNNETWNQSEIRLKFNPSLIDVYKDHYKATTEIILFLAICRYHDRFNDQTKESLQFIPMEFNHIPAIRSFFGHE